MQEKMTIRKKKGETMDINIKVKCTYEVDCDFENVPEEIAQKLLDMDEVKEGSDVFDWLSDHIKEGDASDWEYDVWNVEEI